MKKNEATRQLDKLFEEHNDPQKKEERRILDNRLKREENKLKDLGL
jgi:hypothetical protein